MSYVKPLKLTEQGFPREIAASEDVELGNISLGGAISASSATISGAMSAASATISGNVSAGNLSGSLIEASSGMIAPTFSGNLSGASAMLSGNLYVSGGESTFASATVSDLTATRLVYAGADGALVDDAGLVFDGSDLIAASAKISDLTATRLVYAGSDGALVDDAGLVFDGSDLIAASAKISDLTATRLVYAGADGALVDDAGLVFDGSDLIAASAKISDLTATRVVFAGADGALVDDAGLTYNSSTDALTVVGNVSAGNLSGSLIEASSGMIAPTFSGNLTGTSAMLSGNLYVSGGESTFASATVSDLTATQLVFAGTGGALESSSSLTWDGSDLVVGNVNVGADGVISGVSDPSAAQDAATKAYVDAAASSITLTAGDGIDITSNVVAVDLASSDPGLEFDSNKLAVLLNGSTLSKASGLSVLGLPSAFTIDGSVVSSDFTAANANILVGGSSTDAGHASNLITLNNLAAWNFTADSSGVAQYKPVYISSGSKVAEASASSANQGWVIGVTMGSAASGSQVKVITAGVAPSAISGLGASAGDPIYLNSAGGFTNDPANDIGSGERFVMVGLAINSNDLFVQVRDFGQKA